MEEQLEKHKEYTIFFFHGGGVNLFFGKGRSGNRDRQDGMGKHLNFCCHSSKISYSEKHIYPSPVCQDIPFIPFKKILKTIKTILVELTCLELKIQEMHIITSPLNREED